MSKLYETYGFFIPVKLQMRLLTGSLKGEFMFGNGVSWMCLTLLDLSHNEDKEYVHKEMSVQPGIIDILREPLVSAGLSICRDIRGVEESYILISGEEVRMERGFVSLTSLAVLTEYKFQAKNMIAMGVQVLVTLLNKILSIGEDCWSLRWEEVLEALRCYALELSKFFESMRKEVGFQLSNSSICMRLLYWRIFNEKVIDIECVENVLNQAVSLSFSEEIFMSKKVELEAMIRRERMVWVTSSSSDWEFEERMMWREYIPGLTGLRGRTGVKRAGIRAGGKPGKTKRRRSRALRGTLTIEEADCRFPAQPFSRVPEIGNLSGYLVSGPQQEEEREGVVILDEEEYLLEEDADLESGSWIQDVPGCVFQVVDPSRKRMSAGLGRIREEKPRILFYDEVIEGPSRWGSLMRWSSSLRFHRKKWTSEVDL